MVRDQRRNHREGANAPRFENRMAAFLAQPAFPEKPFIGPDILYQSIYLRAQALKAGLEAVAVPDRPVVLFTEDRALTAASLLAAAARNTPPLVVPYAISETALAEVLRAMPTQGVITDRPQDLPPGTPLIEEIPAAMRFRPLQPASPDRTMVYLFTGGSTGRPQIWPKTARNLFGEAFLLQDHLAIDADDRLLSTVVPYHIYGLLFSVLVPLAASARLVDGIPTYPQEIIRPLNAGEATIVVSVPVHYRTLNGLAFSAAHLRLAISSAGRLEPEDAAAFHRQTGVGVTEIYGSTETGGIAHRNRAQGETALTALPTVDWDVREERLHVRSGFLSPELVTDRKGFFRTGDRAARHADGGFILQGRADGIVKVGGQRVDLEGVQACLKGLPGIADALVLSLPGRHGRENEIVAVVEGAVDGAAIRQALASRVEPYALPRRIIAVEKIPMSAAGKYDRPAAANLFSGV